MIPAGFEPTACRLGGDRSILLSYGTSFSKVLILQDFRGSGDCSPWCLGVVFANQEGRFLIGFSNFGGRIFSHLLILTLRIRSVGLIPFPGRFRTLRPFSAFGKADVDRLIRRAKKRSPLSASECLQMPKYQRFPPFSDVRISSKNRLFYPVRVSRVLAASNFGGRPFSHDVRFC